jgi:hypothetical protein
MPLVAFCLSHFSADFIICTCEFEFRQAQVVAENRTGGARKNRRRPWEDSSCNKEQRAKILAFFSKKKVSLLFFFKKEQKIFAHGLRGGADEVDGPAEVAKYAARASTKSEITVRVEAAAKCGACMRTSRCLDCDGEAP